MKAPSPDDFLYTSDQIARMIIDWCNFNGFTADICHKCNATVNVLAGGPGWICPCGEFHVLPWSNSQIPHERPKYGPSREVIQDGVKMVKYAYYSATHNTMNGHIIYNVRGKPKAITCVCEKKDEGYHWPDKVFVGEVTTKDFVRSNRSGSIIDFNKEFRLSGSLKGIFDTQIMNDLYNKGYRYWPFNMKLLLPSAEEKLRVIPPQPLRITAVGVYQVPTGFSIPDKRLSVTQEWKDEHGMKFAKIETSYEFRKKYGTEAIPVYDEDGVEARWPAKEEPKGRYRWNGTRYVFENK